MNHTLDAQAGEALCFTLGFYYHAIGNTLASPVDDRQHAGPSRALHQRPGGSA